MIEGVFTCARTNGDIYFTVDLSDYNISGKTISDFHIGLTAANSMGSATDIAIYAYSLNGSTLTVMLSQYFTAATSAYTSKYTYIIVF